MSAIEVDLVRFTAGPRKGELAIMVDYKSLIALFDLDGDEIIQWDGSAFQLDRDEWTEEMHFVDQWIDANPWAFVYPSDPHVKRRVFDFARIFRSIKPVEVFTRSRQSIGYRMRIRGMMAILIGAVVSLFSPWNDDEW
jgi:hypothetical protein